MISLSLSARDVDAAAGVAHHYEKVMGAARFFVVATSPPRIRRRYRHIVQESDELEQLADTWLSRLRDSGADEIVAELTIQDLIALWGRLLSSLRTKRSRRRLSKEDVASQQSLSDRLAQYIRDADPGLKVAIRAEIDTRRRREHGWMLTDLRQGYGDDSGIHAAIPQGTIT